jgi:putative transposase
MSSAELPIEHMCALAGVSRRGFYRFDPEAQPAERDMELRDAIQRIALEMPSYGRPRITAELRRRGWVVNAKRVHRIMREDNLLCLRRRRSILTTDSRHTFGIYPNLAGEMKLTNVNQLWIADITYIRLESEFVYLAVVLDAFSRRVIGWALDRTLEAKLTVAALKMTLSRRTVAAGLVHHSDRGVQYAADEYTSLLAQHGIEISMSRKGNPYDNARTESFMKTLKYEEVYRQEYRDLPDALRSLRRFIEKVYNEKRLHSALGYLPPTEFESNLVVTTNNCKEAASRQLSQ